MTKMKKSGYQMSDSLYLALVLAVSGGLMDAYTYLYRGQVFANAQTGNILLLGVNMSENNWSEAVKYLFPIIAFVSGIILAELIRYLFNRSRDFHWRQAAVLSEGIILFIVGFLSDEYNAIANALVSLACGIQVESFRKVLGNASATTMCIGNLRSGTQAICEFCLTRKRGALKKGLIYYSIILFFVLGAITGNAILKLFGQRTIWCSSGLMVMGCMMMFHSKSEKEP